VRVIAEKATQPARVGAFRIDVDAPSIVNDQRHRDGVLRAVKSCLIHNTLLHPPAIDVQMADKEVSVSV
jgi:hypothetical protein